MENEVQTVDAKTVVKQQPRDLIELAIEKGASIEHLTGLMDLQERWEKKEAAKSFKVSMSEFQGDKPALLKTSKVNYINSTGKTTKYNFASLSSIQKLIDPILSKSGLSYRWEQEETENKIKIICIVSHLDGHEESTSISSPLDDSGGKNKIQAIGSTISYLKRYTLEGALGLSSDQDTDGNKPKAKVDPNIQKKAVELAIKNLNSCTDLTELADTYKSLPRLVQAVKEVIELKETLKETLK